MEQPISKTDAASPAPVNAPDELGANIGAIVEAVEAEKPEDSDDPKIGNNVTIISVGGGRASQNCSGFGICWVIAVSQCLYGNCPDVAIQTVGSDSYLRVYFDEGIAYSSTDLYYVDDPYAVSSSAAQALGKNEIVLQTGSYSVVAITGTSTPDYVDIPIASMN